MCSELTERTNLNSPKQEVLIDLIWHFTDKDRISQQSLYTIRVFAIFERGIITLSEKKTVLLPFSTTYLYEMQFSAYTATKAKYRSILSAKLENCLQFNNWTEIQKIEQNNPTINFTFNIYELLFVKLTM